MGLIGPSKFLSGMPKSRLGESGKPAILARSIGVPSQVKTDWDAAVAADSVNMPTNEGISAKK